METRVIREIYDSLLEAGELHDVMPLAVGDWEQDRYKFTLLQESLIHSLSDETYNSTVVDEIMEFSDPDDEFFKDVD